MLTCLGRIPVEGDEVPLPDSHGNPIGPDGRGWIARVLTMDGRRIDRVLLTPVPAIGATREENDRG